VKRTLAVLAVIGCIGGCGGGGSATTAATPPPPPPASVDFTAFAKDLLASQSETALPVPVAMTAFVFKDDDNPEAFASVLPGP